MKEFVQVGSTFSKPPLHEIHFSGGKPATQPSERVLLFLCKSDGKPLVHREQILSAFVLLVCDNLVQAVQLQHRHLENFRLLTFIVIVELRPQYPIKEGSDNF